MITVVHVITKLEMGGAQENTLYTARCLDRSRFRVGLIYGPGGWFDGEASRMENVRREVVPELVREVKPVSDVVCFAKLRRLFVEMYEEHRAHGFGARAFVVHTHSSKAGVIGRLAAKAAGVPVVVHTIHGFGFHPRQHPAKHALFQRAEVIASRATDAFVSVSEANLAEGQARGIVGREQVTAVIRSGFDLAPYLAARSPQKRIAARNVLGLGDADEVVLVIANFKHQKDPLAMVEAIRLAAISRPQIVCLYAGDGELRSEVEGAIARAELGARFRLLGWREDIPELLAACDVVALSSLFEGLPRSAVQAVAAGRPFVGTRVDGTSEIIRDGKNGFLVEPGDPAALGRAIVQALRDRPVDPRDLERVREWDAATMVRRLEELYATLTGSD